MSDANPPTLPAVQATVNRFLNELFAARTTEAARLDPRYEALWATMARTVLGGGKRLRPYLTIWAFAAYGGTNDGIDAVATAQELLHAALLVHDDIIDCDTTRYGKPNIAGHYAQQTDAHTAMSAALLAGDVLLTQAWRLVAESSFSANERFMVMAELQTAVFQTAAGELLDVLAADDADRVVALKTTSYSFARPLFIGARLAGASGAEQDLLARIAEQLGMAYQLHDDLDGVFGDPARTGKSNTSDLAAGTRTRLLQETLARLEPALRTELESLIGTGMISPENAAHVRIAMEQTGAKAAVVAEIAEHCTTATNHIAQLAITPAYAAALRQLVALVARA